MITSGGEDVCPVQVESVLAQHPAVATCALIGVPDETWGERVHAVVVPAVGSVVGAQVARRHTATSLHAATR